MHWTSGPAKLQKFRNGLILYPVLHDFLFFDSSMYHGTEMQCCSTGWINNNYKSTSHFNFYLLSWRTSQVSKGYCHSQLTPRSPHSHLTPHSPCFPLTRCTTKEGRRRLQLSAPASCPKNLCWATVRRIRSSKRILSWEEQRFPLWSPLLSYCTCNIMLSKSGLRTRTWTQSTNPTDSSSPVEIFSAISFIYFYLIQLIPPLFSMCTVFNLKILFRLHSYLLQSFLH